MTGANYNPERETARIFGIEQLPSTRLRQWETDLFKTWDRLSEAKRDHLKAIRAEDYLAAEGWKHAIQRLKRTESELWAEFQEMIKAVSQLEKQEAKSAASND